MAQATRHLRRTLPHTSSTGPFRRSFKLSLIHGGMQPMGTAAAMPLSLDELQQQPPAEIHIFDIFDAPSRLGESSRLLAETSSARPVPARSRQSNDSFADRPGMTRCVKPLPTPILFDGPANSGHLTFGTCGGTSRSSPHEAHSLSTLPPAVTFDGPSRLRPSRRNSGKEKKMFSLSGSLSVAASLGIAVFACSQLEETS